MQTPTRSLSIAFARMRIVTILGLNCKAGIESAEGGGSLALNSFLQLRAVLQ